MRTSSAGPALTITRPPGHGFQPRPHGVVEELAIVLDPGRRAGQQLHEKTSSATGLESFSLPICNDQAIGIARQRRHAVEAPITSTRADFMSVPMAKVRLTKAPPGRRSLQLLETRRALQTRSCGSSSSASTSSGEGGAPLVCNGDLRSLDVRKQLQRQLAQAHQAKQADQQHGPRRRRADCAGRSRSGSGSPRGGRGPPPALHQRFDAPPQTAAGLRAEVAPRPAQGMRRRSRRLRAARPVAGGPRRSVAAQSLTTRLGEQLHLVAVAARQRGSDRRDSPFWCEQHDRSRC